jgi:hypothetical protein
MEEEDASRVVDLSSNASSVPAASSVHVNIVVQLTCTDTRSRYNSFDSGRYEYCLPKSEVCDPTDVRGAQCCGDRRCDVQRRQCTALPDTVLRTDPYTTTDTNSTGMRIGYDSNGSIRTHDRESPLLAGSSSPRDAPTP